MYKPDYLPRIAPIPRADFFNQNLGPKTAAPTNPITHTQDPIVTGTSVLGIKYKDGIMLAADCLASYGSLARFRDISRLHQVSSSTVIAATGDISDFQYIQEMLQKLVIEEYALDDRHKLSPAHFYEYLNVVMYNRRTKLNPLWNMLVVGGYQNGESFLGYVDLKGTTYKASTIATGYGAHIAQPLLRKHVEGNESTLTEENARKIIEESMRVLFYRDCRALNRIQIATITAEGARIGEPYILDTNWDLQKFVKGYD